MYKTSVRARLANFFGSLGSAGRKAREDVARANALPLDTARSQALGLLADPRRFKCIETELTDKSAIQKLGPTLQELFSKFDSIAQINGDFFVSRKSVGASSLRKGFLTFGKDFAYSELVARPGEDEVFIVTDATHRLDGCPSIYHNICLLD